MAYNGHSFTFPVLRRQVITYGVDDYNLLDQNNVIDPFDLIKRECPGLPNYQQKTVSAHLGCSTLMNQYQNALREALDLRDIVNKLLTFSPKGMGQLFTTNHLIANFSNMNFYF